jgi:hypothetical protein
MHRARKAPRGLCVEPLTPAHRFFSASHFFQDVCGTRQTSREVLPRVHPLEPERALAKVNFGKPQNVVAR